MKKIKIFAGCAAIALAAITTSCNSATGGSTATPKTELKSVVDTLSYAYGVNLAQSGLNQYLGQLGIIQDTNMVRSAYNYQIENEQDQAKKQQLQKELTTKLDSLTKANNKNIAEFISGVKESYNAPGKDKEAYYQGLQIGSQFKMMGEEFEKQMLDEGQTVNKTAFLAGIIGTINKEAPLITGADEIIKNKAMEAQAKMMAKQEAEAKKANTATIEAGEKFLAENKTQPGVVTLPSGLQYKIVKEGNGPKPTIQDQVEVFYKGTLLNGEVFDSNIGKASVKFPVGQVIKGWTEALQLMPVGSKWILYIPSDLAYGFQGQGKIPPFATLIFEIDLVSIVK